MLNESQLCPTATFYMYDQPELDHVVGHAVRDAVVLVGVAEARQLASVEALVRAGEEGGDGDEGGGGRQLRGRRHAGQVDHPLSHRLHLGMGPRVPR